jgi:SulP family sulfate permease
MFGHERTEESGRKCIGSAPEVIAAASLSARISPKLPAPLLGIVLAILVSRSLGWSSKEVGWLPASIRDFAGFIWTPRPAGLGLAFVTSVKLLVTSRVVEHFRGRHKAMKATDADRELGAYGIANLAAAGFGAPMSIGSPARSQANVQCGATSCMSNLIHAGLLVLFVLEGAKLIARIPLAALAGVTAWMGVCLMEWSTWSRLHKMRRLDAAAF